MNNLINKIIQKFKQNDKEVIAIMRFSGDELFIVTCNEKDMFNNRYLYNNTNNTFIKYNIQLSILTELELIYSWLH